MFLEDDRLVASAGADALFLLDELDARGARALLELWDKDQLDAAPAALAGAVRDLTRLGAAGPAAEPVGTLGYHLAAVGEAGSLEAALAALTTLDTGLERASLADATLAVVVRAGGTLFEVADFAARIKVPHLFVDLAYEHTLSIGPLVFPGETACVSCLAGRIRFTWGDPPPPPAPLAAGRAAVAAGFLADQLCVFRRTGTCSALVARTLAIDLDAVTTHAERVHRLPWCPVCFPDEGAFGDGSTLLPWAQGTRA